MSVNATIAELEEGLSGRAAPADLETLFQMMHLAFVALWRDADAFAAWRAREAESVKNRRLSPEASEDIGNLQHARSRAAPARHARASAEGRPGPGAWHLPGPLADASDFTFVFVGNVKLDRLKSLVETYLGSLPGKKRQRELA